MVEPVWLMTYSDLLSSLIACVILCYSLVDALWFNKYNNKNKFDKLVIWVKKLIFIKIISKKKKSCFYQRMTFKLIFNLFLILSQLVENGLKSGPARPKQALWSLYLLCSSPLQKEWGERKVVTPFHHF